MTEHKRRLPAKFVCSATAGTFGMLILVLSLGVIALRVRRKRQGYIMILIVDLII